MKVLYALMFVCFATSANASEIPAKIENCVSKTAKTVYEAQSAADLNSRLQGKIHIFALGVRSYGRNWRKILGKGREGIAVRYYLDTLFRSAMEKNAQYEGEKKVFEYKGIDSQTEVFQSYDKPKDTTTAYVAQVAVHTQSMHKPIIILVLVVLEQGNCQFADIGLLEGSSEVWWSKQVSSTAVLE